MSHNNHSVYKKAFEAGLDAIVCSDETGLITLWNPAAEKMFGYNRVEVLGQPVTILIPATHQEKHSQSFSYLISTGESHLSGHIAEVAGVRKDGSTFPVEISLSSVQSGDHWQITAILRDCTGRKKAEAMRLKSERNFRNLVESNCFALAVHRDFNLLYANTSALEMFDIPDMEQILGTSILDYLHPQHRNFARLSINRVIRKKKLISPIQIKGVTANKREFDIDIRSIPVSFDGAPAVVSIMYDVSASKQAEATLRESKKRLHDMIDANPVPTIIARMGDGLIKYANMEFSALFKMPCGEVVGKQMPDYFVHPEQRNTIIKTLGKTGRIQSHEVHLRKQDGTFFWALLTLSTFVFDGGPSLITSFHDITERKRADKLVRKMSSAMDQAGASILITDRDGIIEYVNPAFTKLTGYSAKEAIGQTPRLLKSGGQDDAFYAAMWKTISDGKVWHNKVIDRKKDGSFFPAMLTIAPIFDDDGIITHFVGTHADLSKLEDMEHQFHQAQKMEEIGTLVGGIAHDFNNMLAGITGNVYMAKRDAMQSTELMKRLSNIEEVSHRAAEMISQLLTFARKGIVTMKNIALTPFIKETLKFIRPSVPENITMHEDICAERLFIKGDATQLHQALMNLVNNAHDAVENADKPSIAVMLEAFYTDAAFIEKHPYFETGNYAHLSVEDNGYGITKKQMKHLFEPFFTTKEQGKGTGLGLSMVFGAIKTHHGYVDVESAEGKGSTFHVYIPLLEKQRITLDPVQQQGTTKGHGEMLLVADDDQIVRETTAEVLEAMGYAVVRATDGLDALDVFKTHHSEITLILLDVVMPHLGGVQLAKRIRAMSPDVPIIFMTGYDKGHVLDGNESMPNSEIVTKPLTFNDLNHAISQLLDQM